MSKLFTTSAALALTLLSPLAFAQPGGADVPPAYVAVLDGDVAIARGDGQSVDAIVNMPVVTGDRVTTTAGRVEILFPDGAALDLDERTSAEFAADGRVRLSSGRAILTVPNVVRAARYEIVTPSGTVVTRGPGKYRAGATSAFNTDSFDGWSDGLRAARTATAVSASAQYLPEELQPYDTTLDQNGTWQYAPTYGYVWYPRVDSEWRPYYEGTWATVPSYGWTWIGVHRWEYPTHHYGRWGYAGNRWFWIPGRAYSPAWVSWGYASDYVSWCPLGVDSRPVFAMTAGYGNPWTGWTVLSKSHFGGRGYVPRLAVPGHQVSSQPFVVQNAPPSIAVPRGDAFGVRSGGTAVPRNAVPPTPTMPSPPPPQTILTTPQTPTPYAPGTAVPRERPRRNPPSAPANPGDNPAYAPRYAPNPAYAPQPPQAPPATPPAATTPPSATPSTPPAGSTPPHTPPPAKTTPPPPATATPPPPATTPPPAPPSTATPKTTPPPKSGDGKAKPAENGKARGRGGLQPSDL